MYCDRRNGQKPTRIKKLRQKPPRTIEIEFVQGTFVQDFCTRPTKIRGVRGVWRTFGGSRDVWQSVTGGGGGQNWPKIVWRTLWKAPCTPALRRWRHWATALSIILWSIAGQTSFLPHYGLRTVQILIWSIIKCGAWCKSKSTRYQSMM